MGSGESRAERNKENWKFERGKAHFNVNFDSEGAGTDAKFFLIQGFRTESVIDASLSS